MEYEEQKEGRNRKARDSDIANKLINIVAPPPQKKVGEKAGNLKMKLQRT